MTWRIRLATRRSQRPAGRRHDHERRPRARGRRPARRTTGRVRRRHYARDGQVSDLLDHLEGIGQAGRRTLLNEARAENRAADRGKGRRRARPQDEKACRPGGSVRGGPGAVRAATARHHRDPLTGPCAGRGPALAAGGAKSTATRRNRATWTPGRRGSASRRAVAFSTTTKWKPTPARGARSRTPESEARGTKPPSARTRRKRSASMTPRLQVLPTPGRNGVRVSATAEQRRRIAEHEARHASGGFLLGVPLRLATSVPMESAPARRSLTPTALSWTAT